jgi:hypothetical protein
MRIILRTAEFESRKALRVHGLALAFYMTIIGIGFLRGHPMLGTTPVYEALDDAASPLSWGIALTGIGVIRMIGILLAIQINDNPKPSVFTSVMTGLASALWAFMAYVYFVFASGGSSLALLAFIDASTCVYAARMSGTTSGRRLSGHRTLGN